jgi:hypothetical protein
MTASRTAVSEIIADVVDKTITSLAKGACACCREVDEPVLSREVIHGGGCVIEQLRVLQQRHNGACGYHALYNARTVMRGDGGDGGRSVLRELSCSTMFWRSYWRTKRLLEGQAVARGNKHYPWRLRDISTGVIERSYMLHLVQNTELGADCIALPDMCQASLDNGVLDPLVARELDAGLQSLLPGQCRAFLVGNIGHWTAVVVQRASPVRVFLLDSRNKPLLGVIDFASLVRAHFDDLAVRGKTWPQRSRLEATYLAELVESARSARLIASCACGETTFEVVAVTSPIIRVISSWKSAETKANALTAWLADNPLPILRTTLLYHVVRSLRLIDKSTLLALREWASIVATAKIAHHDGLRSLANDILASI